MEAATGYTDTEARHIVEILDRKRKMLDDEIARFRAQKEEEYRLFERTFRKIIEKPVKKDSSKTKGIGAGGNEADTLAATRIFFEGPSSMRENNSGYQPYREISRHSELSRSLQEASMSGLGAVQKDVRMGVVKDRRGENLALRQVSYNSQGEMPALNFSNPVSNLSKSSPGSFLQGSHMQEHRPNTNTHQLTHIHPDDQSFTHQREIEFQGLFTPHFLPLLDSSDHSAEPTNLETHSVPQKPESIKSLVNAPPDRLTHTVPQITPLTYRTSTKPQRLSTSTTNPPRLSSSTPTRSPPSSSATLHSSLRSPTSKKPRSPKRVHFQIDNVAVPPSSTPPPNPPPTVHAMPWPTKETSPPHEQDPAANAAKLAVADAKEEATGKEGEHQITAAAHPISASAPTSLSLRAEPAKEASPAPAPPPAPRLSAARAAVDDDDGDDMFLLDEEIAAQKDGEHVRGKDDDDDAKSIACVSSVSSVKRGAPGEEGSLPIDIKYPVYVDPRDDLTDSPKAPVTPSSTLPELPQPLTTSLTSPTPHTPLSSPLPRLRAYHRQDTCPLTSPPTHHRHHPTPALTSSTHRPAQTRSPNSAARGRRHREASKLISGESRRRTTHGPLTLPLLTSPHLRTLSRPQERKPTFTRVLPPVSSPRTQRRAHTLRRPSNPTLDSAHDPQHLVSSLLRSVSSTSLETAAPDVEMDVDVAAPTILPLQPPRPRIPIEDYLVRPSSPSVLGTKNRVAAPQSTGAMSFAMASLMPEPPGRMRRDGVGEVGRGGDGDGNGADIGPGRRGDSIAVDVGAVVQGRADGEKDGGKDIGGRREDVDRDGKVPNEAVRAETSGRDTTRRARPSRERGPCNHDGSSAEKAVLIDEGYGSFSFAASASASTNKTPPDLEIREDRRHHDHLDELFEDHAEAGKSDVWRTQDGGARKAVLENAAEEAAMEKVNTFFESRRSRAPDGRAEGQTFQVAGRDGHRRKEPVMLDDGARGLLDVVKKEAEESMRTLSGAGGEGGGGSSLVMPRWQAEVDAHRRAAIDRSRSARGSDWKEDVRQTTSRKDAEGIREDLKDDTEELRLAQERIADLASRSKEERERSRSTRASDGKDEVRPITSHKEADGVRASPKDDTEELRLAQERLIADLTSKSKAKRDREEIRLRKEQEANRQASLVREARNAQIATAASQERTREKTRLARDQESWRAAVARMVPERRERIDVATEAKRKKEAEKLASLRKKAADEAVRRIERNKLDEERRAKAAKIAGPPLVRIKVEDSSSDDAVRSELAQDRAARQAAAERSRTRQAQNGAEEKPTLIEERTFKTSESGQTSVALGLNSSGDEAVVGRRTPSARSSALDSQLHLANENLQAALAEKMILEAKAEARRVQAECTALKRRAEEADAEDSIDQSLHKKARSDDQSVRDSQSTLGSNPPSVEDMSSPRDTEMRAPERPRTKTSEERMRRKRESNKRWRLKKLAERKLLQAQSQQEGGPDYIVGRQAKSSPTASEDNNGTESGQKRPMGLRALCSPGLVSNSQGLQADNDTARSGGHSKPFVPKDHDERPTSNRNPKTARPRGDHNVKSHMMRDRAAKDEYYNNLKATLASFQQPQSSLGPEPDQTGTTETYTAGTPLHQESEESISSDEDEDLTQAVKPTSSPRLSIPQQTPDIPGESQLPPPRPTCARKTLPTQVHKTAPEEADNADTRVSEDEANATATTIPPDQTSPPPELLWAYNITRKEYLHDEDPTTVPHTTDGPYWSLAQANAIAATDVHLERGAVRILAPMEFTLTIDALGLRTHSICSNGGTIATAVERVLVPPSRARGPMADKAWLPRRMFVVLEQVRRGDGDDDGSAGGEEGQGPRARAVRTRGLFTVLDLANREASRWALERRTARLGDSGLDEFVKAEMGMRAREHLERLDREGRTFESSCVVEDGGGVVEVWVEEHPVVGPRN